MALPSTELPASVLAVAHLVAVSALPVSAPVNVVACTLLQTSPTAPSVWVFVVPGVTLPAESMVNFTVPLVLAVIELAPVAANANVAAVAVNMTPAVPVISPTEVKLPVTLAAPVNP